MTINPKLVAVVVVVFMVQLGVPLSMIARRERVLKHGEVFKFQTAPVDPVDVFRGRYVRLNFNQRKVKTDDAGSFSRRQKIYVTVGVSTNGFAEYTGVYSDRPSEGPYIRMRASYIARNSNEVNLDLPFDHYYMNEKLAPAAEAAYRKHSRGSERDAYVTVRVKNGFAVIEELYVADTPIVDFIRNDGK